MIGYRAQMIEIEQIRDRVERAETCSRARKLTHFGGQHKQMQQLRRGLLGHCCDDKGSDVGKFEKRVAFRPVMGYQAFVAKRRFTAPQCRFVTAFLFLKLDAGKRLEIRRRLG